VGGSAAGGDDALGQGHGRVAAPLVLAQHEESRPYVPVGERVVDRLPGEDDQLPNLFLGRLGGERLPGRHELAEPVLGEQALDRGLVAALGVRHLARAHPGGEPLRDA
jgi:hypothetical protein